MLFPPLIKCLTTPRLHLKTLELLVQGKKYFRRLLFLFRNKTNDIGCFSTLHIDYFKFLTQQEMKNLWHIWDITLSRPPPLRSGARGYREGRHSPNSSLLIAIAHPRCISDYLYNYCLAPEIQKQAYQWPQKGHVSAKNFKKIFIVWLWKGTLYTSQMC